MNLLVMFVDVMLRRVLSGIRLLKFSQLKKDKRKFFVLFDFGGNCWCGSFDLFYKKVLPVLF